MIRPPRNRVHNHTDSGGEDSRAVLWTCANGHSWIGGVPTSPTKRKDIACPTCDSRKLRKTTVGVQEHIATLFPTTGPTKAMIDGARDARRRHHQQRTTR